jgi:hypothetical protein
VNGRRTGALIRVQKSLEGMSEVEVIVEVLNGRIVRAAVVISGGISFASFGAAEVGCVCATDVIPGSAVAAPSVVATNKASRRLMLS